jgi:23S rRNA (cytidine1920-2'-O)/16S rRNA (cytidine1409-2'-O)-methyltransferase
VVRNPSVHEEVLNGIIRFAEGLGLAVVDAVRSPLRGPKGNIEFFLLLLDRSETTDISSLNEAKIKEIVSHY